MLHMYFLYLTNIHYFFSCGPFNLFLRIWIVRILVVVQQPGNFKLPFLNCLNITIHNCWFNYWLIHILSIFFLGNINCKSYIQISISNLCMTDSLNSSESFIWAQLKVSSYKVEQISTFCNKLLCMRTEFSRVFFNAWMHTTLCNCAKKPMWYSTN